MAIVEPARVHHNQPMWTLVGAGIKRIEETRRAMADVLPSQVQAHMLHMLLQRSFKSLIATEVSFCLVFHCRHNG